jgi:hypothetical protein
MLPLFFDVVVLISIDVDLERVLGLYREEANTRKENHIQYNASMRNQA